MPEVVKMKDAKGLDKQWVVLSELASKLVEKNISVPEEAFEKAKNWLYLYLEKAAKTHLEGELCLFLQKKF